LRLCIVLYIAVISTVVDVKYIVLTSHIMHIIGPREFSRGVSSWTVRLVIPPPIACLSTYHRLHYAYPPISIPSYIRTREYLRSIDALYAIYSGAGTFDCRWDTFAYVTPNKRPNRR